MGASQDVQQMEPSISDEVQENTRTLERLEHVVRAVAHAQRASIAYTETQAEITAERTPIIQYTSKRDSEGFGEFLIPEHARWYCQICQKRPLVPGSQAFGCQREYADDEHTLYDNTGCCGECYRELGWMDAADELKDMKHHKDAAKSARTRQVEEPRAEEPKAEKQPTDVRLAEYVSSRDEEGFGVYRIPDNKYTYYCSLCGKQPLERGSLAFGCQREYESDPVHECDNLGCCYECAEARGWKKTVHALKHKGCHCRR